MNYPTLTIGPTVRGVIGTSPSKVLSYSIKGLNSLTSTSVFTSLTITVYHECTGATITPDPSIKII